MGAEHAFEVYVRPDLKFYVVCDLDTHVPHLESPEWQALPDDVVQESLCRVFLTREDAERYREAVEKFDCSKTVNEYTMRGLWLRKERLEAQSLLVYMCHLRIDLSTMPENEWPRSIDTIWGANVTVH